LSTDQRSSFAHQTARKTALSPTQYDESRQAGARRASGERRIALSQNGWTDPDRLDSFDCTLANLAEIVLGTLSAAGARTVVEVGAENGLFTRKLLDWGAASGDSRVLAIDPDPRPLLEELDQARPDLELIREPSHEGLATLERTDAVILDGDHNYFTVEGELRLIAERSADGGWRGSAGWLRSGAPRQPVPVLARASQ
jgi:hypothetical protein